MGEIKVAAVQFAPVFRDKSANVEFITDAIESIHADIVIFPELALTGYFFLDRSESMELAENFNGKLIKHFKDLSHRCSKIVIIGFIEEFEGALYNSAAVLFPDSNLNAVYRKTHLFYKERFCFNYGNTGFSSIYFPEWDLKLGTMICYDWRFPEAARTLALMGADLIACPSNLVTKIWSKVIPARAIENKVYLAVANRIGSESRDSEALSFNGNSMILDYMGDTMDIANETDQAIITAFINPSETRDKSINLYNDIFKDRKSEMYK